MRFSRSLIPTLRQDPRAADCTSQRLLLKGGYLFMSLSGIYTYLPLGLRVLKKIEAVIRRHMQDSGGCELFMNALQSLDIWRKTGRDQDLDEVMFKIKDKKGRDLCLGPTHEEQITEIARSYIHSYKQLPLLLYQIQTKFRDEIRPRFGLIRSCEFIMKDAYSFDVDQAGLDKCYQKMLDAYKKIFKECGLSVITTEADSGAMGGSVSHEFMVPADIGEDILYYCQGCDLYFSQDVCPQCNNNGQQQQKAIEIGHIFKLGTKYSETQDACFLDDAGVKKPIIMGCYGIGVSRLLPAIVEQNHDQQGIIWPRAISCFDANILLLKPDDSQLSDAAVQAYDKIQAAGFDVLLDDRQQGPGVKFNDAYLIGSPYIIIVGKKFRQTNLFEVEKRSDGEKQELTLEQLINYLKTEYERK